jgi:hypothetical protein
MEITANAVQTVAANQDVLFTNVAIAGNSSTVHRSGSGQVTLRGLTNCQCRARFRVTFGGNIAVPADGTAGPISLAIAIDGEPINTTTMIYTPTAVSTYGNIFGAIFIDIPRGCCGKVSVRNISTIPVSVQNANLIVEMVA